MLQLYSIHSVKGNFVSRAYHRTNDFRHLHSICSSKTKAKLPEKSSTLFKKKRLDDEFAKHRIIELNSYLNQATADAESLFPIEFNSFISPRFNFLNFIFLRQNHRF